MAFIERDGVARCVFDLTVNGQGASTTVWGKFALGTPSTTDFADIAEFLDAWAGAQLRALMATDGTYEGVTVYDMSAEEGTVYFNNTSAGAGAVAADSEPNQVALVVNLKTAKRGRHYRGRMYIPAIPETHVVDGIISTAALGNWQEVFDALNTAFIGSDWNWVVASTFHPDMGTPFGEETEVSVVTVRQQTGTQRRRTKRI